MKRHNAAFQGARAKRLARKKCRDEGHVWARKMSYWPFSNVHGYRKCLRCSAGVMVMRKALRRGERRYTCPEPDCQMVFIGTPKDLEEQLEAHHAVLGH